VNDKDLNEVLPLFPTTAIYYFCKPNIPRGLDAKTLQEEAQKYHLHGNIFTSVSEAYESAKNNATNDDFIFIGGSTFVVAELPLNKGM
jgi:dihydrofolate synthase/folylpolyglutamate synthase